MTFRPTLHWRSRWERRRRARVLPLDPAELGRRLRVLREARGLSQEHVATKLRVAPPVVGRWERGEALPRERNLDAALDLYGAPKDEVLAGLISAPAGAS